MPKRRAAHVRLTPSEREIMPLLARGLSDEEMAVELGITVAGIRSRLRGLREKTGASGRRAITFAWDHLSCCAGVDGPGAA